MINLSPENATLQQRIEEKLALLAQVEDSLPVVVIVHQLQDFKVVYMSEKGRRELGITLDDLHELGAGYHDRFFNPEDVKDYLPKIKGLLERNNDDSISFFQQVRLSESDDWRWYLSSSKIFMRDDEGQPLLTITTATPIDPKHHVTAKVERLLQENNFLRRHQQVFAALTRREREILKLMALGHHSGEIAEQLHISETTAATHRRNIRAKLGVQTNYDITRFAQAFDLL